MAGRGITSPATFNRVVNDFEYSIKLVESLGLYNPNSTVEEFRKILEFVLMLKKKEALIQVCRTKLSIFFGFL